MAKYMEFWKHPFSDLQKQRSKSYHPGSSRILILLPKVHINPPLGWDDCTWIQWVDVKTLTMGSILLRFLTWPVSVTQGDLSPWILLSPSPQRPSRWCLYCQYSHIHKCKQDREKNYSELLYMKNCTRDRWERQIALWLSTDREAMYSLNIFITRKLNFDSCDIWGRLALRDHN